MAQKVRIKLKSFDHTLVDQSAEKIVKTVKNSGAIISGQFHFLRIKEYILYYVLLTLISKQENSFNLLII